MKTSNENQKGWIKRFALMAAVVALSQVFVACGGGGGGGSSAPVPIPIGVGIGVNNFSSANCGGTTNGVIACAIGTYPGMEVLVQISTVGQQPAYGMNSYSGPVIVTGVINIINSGYNGGFGGGGSFGGIGCTAPTSYSFTSASTGGMYYSSALNQLQGTAIATGGVGGQIQINFARTILSATGVNAVSSTGQSFPYHIMGDVLINGSDYFLN